MRGGPMIVKRSNNGMLYDALLKYLVISLVKKMLGSIYNG